MGTTQSICCIDNRNVTHSSAGVIVWTYVDWDFLIAYVSDE
jgi:hypothetical protein